MDLSALVAAQNALPSMPKVVALLAAALSRPDPDLRRVSQLIGSDPALAARVLCHANRPGAPTSAGVSAVAEALALLSTADLREVLAGAQQHLGARAAPGLDLVAFARYSVDVGKVARSLAGLLRLNQGAAFTAGLLHALGELAMLAAMPERMAFVAQVAPPLHPRRAAAERRLLGYDFAAATAELAMAWQWPTPLVRALADQHAPFDRGAYHPLAAILHLAVWRARAREAQLDAAALMRTFPDVVGLALELDLDAVLQQDPIDWSAPRGAAALTPV